MSDPQSVISQEEYENILRRSPLREHLGIPKDWGQVREAFHPFSPKRIILLTQKMLQASGERNRLAFSAPTISSEKFDLLVLLMDRIANHYERPDLAEEWAARLVLREGMGTAQLGPGLALLHQFQFQGDPVETITINNRPVDWWLILFPEGAEYQSLDGNLIHVLIGHVFDHSRRGLETEVYGLTQGFAREVQKEYPWDSIAQMDRVAAIRLLNYRLALHLKGEPEA